MNMDEENSSPLVSIVVITYNSSKYVLETLESAKNQTYRNIELLVSDDGSTDNTVTICENWLNKNKTFFKRTKIITVDKNTGISPNCNRGLNEAKGEWVKFIAGDDILLDNCISTNIDYTKKKNYSFFFSKLKYTVEDPNIISIFEKGYKLFNTKENQLKILLKGNCLPAATAFMNKAKLINIGGFDDNYPMLEDYPLWIKVVKNNYKLAYFNEETVMYRIHFESISNNNSVIDITNPYFFSKHYLYHKSCYLFTKNILIKEQFFKSLFLRVYQSLVFIMLFKTYESFKTVNKLFFLLIYQIILLLSIDYYKIKYSKLKAKLH